jgi:hypothetical protein
MHNEEASYYHHLFRTTASILKKIYYQRESKLLSRYQNKMDKEVQACLFIGKRHSVIRQRLRISTDAFYSLFHSLAIRSYQKQGKGPIAYTMATYVFQKMKKQALWLIKHVFSTVRIPLIVAGKGISKRLKEAAKNHRQISLVTDPTIPIIDGLIRAAQINVLPSMNSTGCQAKTVECFAKWQALYYKFQRDKGKPHQ